MDNFQKDLIYVLKSALSNEKHTISNDFDFNLALKTAKKHNIAVMLYYGLINCGVDESLPIIQQLFMITCQNVATSERQLYALNEIFAEFDKAGIDYMPLKGTLLKNLYRKPEMRAMGDADILIKLDQYNDIRPIMKKLNYIDVVESDPEFVWKKTGSYIELHKGLVAPHNKDFYDYYGDGWKVAKIKDGTRYSMTDEDQLIYLFTHFSKHYRNAGIGIKHFIDLWVFRNSNSNLDNEYIKKELKKLNLYDFYVNINKTLSVWFENEPEDSVSNFITDTIFDSGCFGNIDNYALSDTLKASKTIGSISGKKTRDVFFSLFLPYRDMCNKYNILKKIPILLPFFWLVRGFSFITKKEKVKKYINRYSNLTEENVNNYEKALNFVGLGFDHFDNK